MKKVFIALMCMLFASFAFAAGDPLPAVDAFDSDTVAHEYTEFVADDTVEVVDHCIVTGEITQSYNQDVKKSQTFVLPINCERTTGGKAEVGWRS